MQFFNLIVLIITVCFCCNNTAMDWRNVCPASPLETNMEAVCELENPNNVRKNIYLITMATAFSACSFACLNKGVEAFHQYKIYSQCAREFASLQMQLDQIQEETDSEEPERKDNTIVQISYSEADIKKLKRKFKKMVWDAVGYGSYAAIVAGITRMHYSVFNL